MWVLNKEKKIRHLSQIKHRHTQKEKPEKVWTYIYKMHKKRQKKKKKKTDEEQTEPYHAKQPDVQQR